MNSDHQDTHADLAASIRNYAQRSNALARHRRLRDDPEGFDREAWRQAGNLGWLGMMVPERSGGMGLGLDEATVLAREAGRALLPEPLVAGAVLAAGVLSSSDAPRASDLMRRLVSGEDFLAVAWQETLGDLDADRVSTLVRDGALFGTKAFVVFGAVAAGWLVSARNADGVGVYWVAATSRGATYRPARRADGSELGLLDLDGVEVSAGDLLVPHGRGTCVVSDAVNAGVVASAAELLGVADRALEITLEHLRTRVQFGKAIGSFQALQHRCVDMFIRKELGAAALGAVLEAWPGADATRRSALASRVKARCADTALDIGRQSVQMHGAMGFTDECDIGLYLKRALVVSAWLGNAQVHRRRYARTALGDAGIHHASEAA